MLEKSESFLRRGNPIQKVLAGAIRSYLDAGGKDISLTPFELASELELATREYRNNRKDPELLTQFMRSFWAEVGQRIGRSIVIDKFSLSAKEIKEEQKEGRMAIFIPDGVTREDLIKVFPEMGSWAVKFEGDFAVDVVNNSGWLWIEASVDAPNRNTTQRQLKEKFKKEGKQGQSYKTYIIGSQISKLLTGQYFDEGSTWSRLLGSCNEGCFFCFGFDSDGDLLDCPALHPELHNEGIGGRSEEVIKPQG